MSQSNKSTSCPLVGIDFGTTKTMVAVYDLGKSHARTQRLGRGRDELPTAMFTTSSGELLFGDEAEDEGESDQVNLMRRFKMKLGHPGPAIVGRRKATAEELAADFLGYLKKRLEEEVLHEQLQRAVLTVPAMFGPAQRKSLMNAANAAGFSDVTLLDEPTAAGLAYCDHNPVGKDLCFLVVDWGGGTFDVALLERSPNRGTKIIREFVAGLGDIGGEALDDDLWGHVTQSLVDAGYERLDRQDRNMWGRYRREIARSKERLSNVDSVKMNFLMNGGNPVRIDFQKSILEDAISANVAKGANFVAELLDRCRAGGQMPDFVLLAGGTSRIPMIQRVFEERLQLECRKWSEGREAIALGAALHARDLWQPHESPNGSQHKAALNGKMEAMSIYRGLLEAAWVDGVISTEERVFLRKRRKEFGLTIEESRSLEIQILGTSIGDVIESEVAESIQGSCPPERCSDSQSEKDNTCGQQRGIDLRFDLEITHEEATNGVEKELEIERYVECWACKGTEPHNCGACNGEGLIPKDCRIKLSIPAGATSGTRICSTGNGDAALKGGLPGDLYVLLNVRASQTGRSRPNSTNDQFDIVLTGIGNNKIAVINALREVVPRCGLADAKEIAENTPTTFLRNASRDSSFEIKSHMESAGASVLIVRSASTSTVEDANKDFGSINISSDPGYSERKFICPNRTCSKEIILTPLEFMSRTYACPYCKTSGSISSNTRASMTQNLFVPATRLDGTADRDQVLNLIGKFTSEIPDDSTYVWPKLPTQKIKNAAVSYAKVNLSEILLLHDSTVFGSAKDGFIMTSTHIFWKDMNEQPKSIKFSDIATVVENTGSTFIGAGLRINGIPFTPNGGFNSKRVCGMFLKLILAIRHLHLGR